LVKEKDRFELEITVVYQLVKITLINRSPKAQATRTLYQQ